MIMDSNITTTPGNSPVRNVPDDYYPKGCGFWYVLPEGPDAGKKLFYRFSTHGEGAPESTIVFVHGNPESSYIYRNVIKEITTRARGPFAVLAMDHIGFGLSDQASYRMECLNHAENLLLLVRELDLRNVTLVVHDWGGPIGIGAFLKEPERVSNLVVTNSTVFPMPEQGPTYRNYPITWLGWSQVPLIMPNWFWGSYSSYAVFRTPAKPFRLIAELLLYMLKAEVGIFPGREDEKKARRLFKEQFRSKPNVSASKRFVRQSAVWGHGNRFKEPTLGTQDTAPFYRFIQENVGRAWGPEGRNIRVRAVLGRWDALGKDEVIKQWVDNLPQLEGHVKVFEGVGHFIDEVKPGEVADSIMEVAGLL
ncbi:MAG: alpha/beta fold hydrolase [Actinobacteria bacterium]|nr:alpha/beta fold hydrolase [Actinomycetota bacterium]